MQGLVPKIPKFIGAHICLPGIPRAAHVPRMIRIYRHGCTKTIQNHPNSLCQGLLKDTLVQSQTKFILIHQVRWKQVISTINLADLGIEHVEHSSTIIPWNATREQPQGPFWVCQWPLKPDMQNGLNHWQHQERQTGMVVRYSNDLNCSSGDKALRILRQTLVFLNLFPRRPTGSYCKSRASKGQPLHPSLWLWWQWPSNHMTKAACFPSAGGH